MKYILLSIMLFCISCSQSADSKLTQQNNTNQTTNPEKEKIIASALTFINSYVENCNSVNNSLDVMDWVNSNKLTSQTFKNKLKSIIDEALKSDPELGLGADPIFDAQDYPENGFEFESFNEATNYIVVRGKNWSEFKVAIKMKKQDNNWIVDGCGIVNIPENQQAKR